jgi:excisionase family DNA binding protein
LNAKEVAAALRVDLSTVYRWVHTGTLNAVQFGAFRLHGTHPPAPSLRASFPLRSQSAHTGRPKRPRAAAAQDRPADATRQDDHQVSSPARVCRHGEIVPAGGSCPRCQAEKVERTRRRGSTTARGYGGAHRALRKRLAPFVASGQTRCARCGEIILPGTPFDLGHVDGDRTRYHGLEHAACNRGAAGTPRNRGRMSHCANPKGTEECR